MGDHVRARPFPAGIRARVTALGLIPYRQTSTQGGNA